MPSATNPTRLHEVIEAHLFAIAADGRAKNTVKGRRQILMRLLAVVGPIYVKNIEPHHIDRLMVDLATTRGVRTRNNDITHLGTFFKWCRQRKIIPLSCDPMAGRGRQRGFAPVMRRVGVAQFGDLMDAADHPRDRMVIALGLFLFLRASEMQTLTLGDLHLDRGEIDVTLWKTRERDVMPICSELDEELRRWLTFYTRQVGPLEQDFLLVPAKQTIQFRYDPVTRRLQRAKAEERLKVRKPISSIERVVQRALVRLGYAIRDEDDRSLRDGIHTLRRSGARALFDQLRTDGYDGALQRVKAMLHHKNASQTEHYIGVDVENLQRNELLRGRRMYSRQADNVVELRKVSSGGVAGDGSGV